MVKLEEFANLTKKEENLLHKNYFETIVASLKTTITQSDLKFQSKACQIKHSNLLASMLLEHKKNSLLLSFKKRSDGQARFILEYSPTTLINNFLTCLEYKIGSHGIQNKAEPGFSINYSSDKAKFKASLKDNPMIMNFSLTAGKPEYGMGLN